jgi:LacI family transcriptional regulator
VSDETRERIIEIAQKMGYRSNSIARTMKSGRFKSIALLLSSNEGRGWMPEGFLEHLHDELALHDLHLIVARLTDDQLFNAETPPRVLSEWMCDGLIINYLGHVPQQFLNLIHRYKVPAIWVNNKQETDCAYPDDYDNALQVTRHLLELGHTRISLLAFRSDAHAPHYSNYDRRYGYLTAMKEAGCPPLLCCGPGLDLPFDAVFDSCVKLLKQRDRPSAIIGITHVEAAVVAHAALHVGLRVPQDLSLTTFSFGTIIEGPSRLTYLRLPSNMGNIAMRLLLQKIEEPTQAIPAVTIPGELVIGTSTGPPAQLRPKSIR